MFLALLYTLSKKKKKIQHSQMENVPSSIFLGRLCEIVKSLQGMLGEFGMRKLLTHTHTHTADMTDGLSQRCFCILAKTRLK